MYSRLKTSLLSHFKPSSKCDDKRLRHSMAECQIGSASCDETGSAHYCTQCTHNCQRGVAGDTFYSIHPSTTTLLQYGDSVRSTVTFNDNTVTHDYDTPEEDDEMPQMMPHFALSWNVKYIGSFPISNTTAEHVSSRLDKFVPTNSQNVELSVSVLGVRISCEEMVLMSHSLRRVTSVVGKHDQRRVAYTAQEPAGRTYRRLCHVFQTHDMYQIEEIESVLGNAFQAAILTRQTSLSKPVNNTPISTPTATMTEKRYSSSAFLNKFLGKKGSQTIDEGCKRKRRPVSAVFSSAIHKLSSSTTSMSAKRMTTIETGNKRDELAGFPMRIASPVPEEPTPSVRERENKKMIVEEEEKRRSKISDFSSKGSDSSGKSSSESTSSLVYDEKLCEWIYPVDESMKQQLENCNYFVGLPTRETLVRNLLSQPEGAFVVRYSESKRRCLALSIRVPVAHNPAGISHYLIVKNESGFRIKGFQKHFASLQMLITHHSVIQEQLPVPMHFVQWNKKDWQNGQKRDDKSNRHSTALTKMDENRNVVRRDVETPKRRSKMYGHDFDYRKSKFFDIDA